MAHLFTCMLAYCLHDNLMQMGPSTICALQDTFFETCSQYFVILGFIIANSVADIKSSSLESVLKTLC